ncbi:response regulator transcription factor [Micromonosporaceae bacterium Da 78-11]
MAPVAAVTSPAEVDPAEVDPAGVDPAEVDPVGSGKSGGGQVSERVVRVLLVDDDALVRAGLTMMLEAFDGIEVAGAVSDGTEVAAAVNTFRPDVVLMDIRMPGLDGITATASLRARRDPPEVIVLTTFDTDDHVLRALRAGAGGFLLKHTPPVEIARAVRRVAAGEPIMSPEVLRRMIGYVTAGEVDPGRDRARVALQRLSPGERDVAMLIAQGRTNQEIAAALMMSTATVKAYVSRIFVKLTLTNRVQIALLVHDAR